MQINHNQSLGGYIFEYLEYLSVGVQFDVNEK